jgi:hypothetical protein
MTTNTDAVIVCRTLRQLDALVAESLFGWVWWYDAADNEHRILSPTFSPEGALTRWQRCDRPDDPCGAWFMRLHDYTTWAMLGEVVAKVEAAGYYWEVGGAPKNHHAFLWGKSTMKNEQPEIVADHQSTAPVALCLAALASVGINVTYSPEEDMSHFGADSH